MRKWQSRSQLSPDDEFMCPPLPGQVPVEPTVTSTGPTAQGAVEASPANRSSTGKFSFRFFLIQNVLVGRSSNIYLCFRTFREQSKVTFP